MAHRLPHTKRCLTAIQNIGKRADQSIVNQRKHAPFKIRRLEYHIRKLWRYVHSKNKLVRAAARNLLWELGDFYASFRLVADYEHTSF